MAEAADLDAFDAMDAAELARRLSGPRDEVAGFIRGAAVAGSAEAQARYGQMLLDGDGIAQDQRQGLHWFERAAAAGHVEAINMIGRCHDLGWGTPVDKARAAAWFHAAALRGLGWGMYNYATALALGAGIAEDRPQALDWFRKAAAQGNAKAINFIGSFYEDGWVVDRDLAEAARHYERAAAGGDFRGQFNHARMLLAAGREAEALDWMARAWQGGNPRFRAQMTGWLADQPVSVREPARVFMAAIDSQYHSR
jgi:TPR repeat protein